MRQWFSAINGVINTKKIHLHVLNYNLPSYLSRWLPCIKICIVEMVPFLVKYGKLTKPSSRMIVGDVVMRAITADPVLRQYLPCLRWWGGGGGNPHGAEVLWRDFFWPAESGMFCMDARCNASVLQLNWYVKWKWQFLSRTGKKRSHPNWVNIKDTKKL